MAIETVGQYRINAAVELTREACCTCGIQFAMPTDFTNYRLRNHNHGFYCPNGHVMHYSGKTEAQNLRDELERARTYHAETREQLAAERKHHSATKGKLTKTINRARAGVCPFCTRTFQNVQRHIDGQHPEGDA